VGKLKENFSFVARVSKMGKRHKMITVPTKSKIEAGDPVKVEKITPFAYISQTKKK